MKKTLVASFIALPLLSLSSLAFAATEPISNEPMLLAEHDMDSVTAGGRHDRCDRYDRYDRHGGHGRNSQPTGSQSPASQSPASQGGGNTNIASIIQYINAPVTVIQTGDNNTAIIYVINKTVAMIRQR